MHTLIKRLEKGISFMLKHHIHWYGGIALLFLLNHKYVMYPDEFSNLLGGKLILQGLIPYRDIFDHHMPGGWYLGSILLIFALGSFEVARAVWALFAFAGLLTVVLWIKKHYVEYYRTSLLVIAIYPLLGTYFWFHMFLADSIAGLFFVMTFMILIVQTLSKKIHRGSQFVASFLIFMIIFTSLSYVYLAGALYLWQLYLLLSHKPSWRKFLIFSGVAAAPYVLYGLYLLITGSLDDFYTANIVYNTEHYISIPNYVKGQYFNPIKFALTLIYNFLGTYIVLLSQIKNFDLFFPMGVLSGLGTLALLVMLTRKNVIIGIIYFMILSFSAPRSTITKLNETDYQMSMFLILGLVSAAFALAMLRRVRTHDTTLHDLARVVSFILVLFGFFSILFLANNSYSKYYQRYTQKMPSIVNYSHTATFLDDILQKDERYWVGPFQPEDQFFVKNPSLPGKYFYLMPQFRESEYFKNDFLKQFEEHPPKVIIFNHQASIFMTPADEFGEFFAKWMDGKYFQLKNEDVELIKSPSTFDFKSDMYIRVEDKEEMLKRLQDKGYIK
ncbi:hypothetical protein KBD81_00865 [Candidatus Woesebacteria bacterium]|nr:hypothetical protein [Candidatus Woesebacteria bacterium]